MSSSNNSKAEKKFLEQQLGQGTHSLRRIHEYYLPVYKWVSSLLQKTSSDGTLIVGINGQQGCGKSTLCHHLCELLKFSGRRAVTISVDDFYLTNDQQKELAAKYQGNPYLQPRGYPGTHDIKLAVTTLRAAQELNAGEQMLLPRYDKSAFAGQGDRYPQSQWTEVSGPVDVILFEGWMLGYSKIHDLNFSDKKLFQINEILDNYLEWNALFDGFIHLDSNDLNNVIQWRIEAEASMKAAGKSGMTRAEVEAYVHLFLPCYEVYLPWLRVNPPAANHYLRLELAQDRLPVSRNFV